MLEVLLDKLVWRSRVVVGGQRRVNFFIKHLLVDDEGRFAGATQWICQMQDPVIVVHCVLDTWWQHAKTHKSRAFRIGCVC